MSGAETTAEAMSAASTLPVMPTTSMPVVVLTTRETTVAMPAPQRKAATSTGRGSGSCRSMR